MMRRDIGTWGNEEVIVPSVAPHAPAAPSPTARSAPDRRPYPTPASAGQVLHSEDAEVEIVELRPSPARAETRPISRLSDRLSRVDSSPDDGMEEPLAMIEAVEEAEVEIVLLDETEHTKGGSGADKTPPARTS
jgi:hypothetical protein